MRISGSENGNPQSGAISMAQTADPVSKQIQSQILKAQQSLQKLSSNEEMSVEEKMERRQELQKQIADLNSQLRQHQMELRKEKQKENSSSVNEMLGSKGEKEENPGLSQSGIKSMISADFAVSQAQLQGDVAAKLEGASRVLRSEIRMDAGRGKVSEAKEEALAGLEKRAVRAAAAQTGILADAKKELSKESEAQQKKEASRRKDFQTRFDISI